MLPRWSTVISQLSKVGLRKNMDYSKYLHVGCGNYSKVAAAATTIEADSSLHGVSTNPQVNLNKLFWSKPSSLALAPDSPLRIEEPKYEGFRRIMLKLLLFYSKQSKSIRGANVIYRRIISQVDKQPIYDVFYLEKTFKTTFSLLVLHMWLCLHRLKEEGKEGVELGQYVYEIYNHDLELRVSKAGVNLLLSRWMKDLEKIFYGNVVAYNAAVLPEARQDELQKVIWRNVFSDDGSPMPNDAASVAVQAMTRYVRRESYCLSLTDKEAIFSGNFMFSSLQNLSPDAKR
ncbi:ubiquinol-cytochrome-c reductase complex assembly factor 1 [Macadamia integrifolia]|uniref:ubiquinol-cytochrome-c reductase complex assembly factor 1 n=1 Tax=Macadamia integrifolia TaxID=60698 RepID=UPI001C4EC31C|nr:ubiquinol-cytochrome-c reductase complex assembly factor 1 [Macadamia integrifolia]XP_042507011.1 ubiquinol-cytochrome-c reductase complex assembly factor 1 [Macadamia integrifolia]